LGFDFSGAARFEVLLKEHTLMRHVLIDEPEAIAVHGDNETRAHLAQRFKVRNLFRPRQACGSVGARSGEIRGPIPYCRNLRRSDAGAK